MAAKPQVALKHQDMRDLMRLPRSALASHLRKKVDELADVSRYPLLFAFLPQNLWPWVRSYLKYVFHRKHAFMSYPDSGNRGCYALEAANGSEPVRIAVVGDWGTGTAEADQVAQCMLQFKPDYTIHLGDVYYVGDSDEIEENCLGQSRAGYHGVTWPKGSVGSFALNSNHEMYANGDGYFDVLIPTLGTPGSKDKTQLTSYFCLQNDTWRILGIDTGYNSTGLPVLAQIPLINLIPGVGPTCKLEEPLLDWLRAILRADAAPRATIILSHHQYFSAFEGGYREPASQLMEFFKDQEVLWLWGHEHRMAIYDRYADQAIAAYGRCVGHGGMPIELIQPQSGSKVPLRFWDDRQYTKAGDTPLGFNGFVNLELAGRIATLDYRDLNDTTVFKERFEAVGQRLVQTTL